MRKTQIFPAFSEIPIQRISKIPGQKVTKPPGENISVLSGRFMYNLFAHFPLHLHIGFMNKCLPYNWIIFSFALQHQHIQVI